MGKRFMLLLTVLAAVLAGCSPRSGSGTGPSVSSSIDWVDFVKLDGRMYTGLYNRVIRDPELVTNRVAGEVKFRVADSVTDPGYRIRNGDAAYLAPGTPLYQVEGFGPDELIAVRDESRIGGYRLYAEDSFFRTILRHYPDIPKDRVERIELFEAGAVRAFRTLTGEEKDRFIELLDGGEDRHDFFPDLTNGDPVYYTMVFYTDETLGYSHYMEDDGTTVYFHPDLTRVVDDEIRKFLSAN